MNMTITYKEYERILLQDSEGKFVNLIIPASETESELNLIGKSPQDFTIEEVMRMKKYAGELFSKVDKSTIK